MTAMKDLVIALDAIPSILASTTVTNARPGAVVRRRAATSAAIGAPAQACSSLRRSPRAAPRRVGADVERWTATRCPSAALAAL
ncbi:hypothetical protein [Sorangium sp. So ce861]|uniref:hypothetical protein n=1 Tax=Sorangium sp. So ce861 TaxID=3133323 RepID=UPI003F63EAD8